MSDSSMQNNNQKNHEANEAEASVQETNGVRANVLTPGELLRVARERKELALSTVGKQLKLDSRVIQALENNQFDKIGAPVFVKGHLRKYASFVGLEPNDVMFAYHQIARTQDTVPVISQTTPMVDPKPKYAWIATSLIRLFVALLVAALLYGAYQLWNWYLDDASASLENSTNGVNQATSTLVLPQRNSNTNLDTVADDVSASQAIDADSISEVSSQTEVGTTDDALTEDGETLVTEDLPSLEVNEDAELELSQSASLDPIVDRLRLEFTDECWVLIKDSRGQNMMNAIGNAGDVREFELTGDTEIRIGNINGVRLSLNGEPYEIPRRARSGRTATFQLVSQ